MRNLKLLLVFCAVAFSSTAFANTNKFTDPDSVTMEIENIVCERENITGKSYAVTIFFSISDDNRIQSLTVASPNEEVNQLLLEKLSSQELLGEKWMKGKIYELSVMIG